MSASRRALGVALVPILVGAHGWRGRAFAGDALGLPAAPEGYASASVRELAREDRWRDQKVLFEGLVAKVGCVGCGGVILADRTWRISVEPEDSSKFRIPRRTGARLRVWGVLRVGQDGFREVKAHRVQFLPAGGQERS